MNSSQSTQPISLSRLELIEVALPQQESFRSAIGSRNERRALYLRWWDRDENWGIGECSCRPDPLYSAEFNEVVKKLIGGYLFERLPSEGTVGKIVALLDTIRGWPFSRAALLDAVFDLIRRRGGSDALDALPPRVEEIPAGISLGIFSTATEAVTRVEQALAQGYRRIKLKVRPSMDLEPLIAIRESAPDAPLAFDANGSCNRADLTRFLPALLALDPLFIEQPFSPRRLDLCAELKRRQPHARICLDEAVEERGDLLLALRMSAIDELNLKPGRVGGQLASIALLEECRERGIPMWVGGMFETGIGRCANLRFAARMPGAAAHDLSPSTRYFPRDVVISPLEMNTQGYIPALPETPVAVDETALRDLTCDHIILEKPA